MFMIFNARAADGTYNAPSQRQLYIPKALISSFIEQKIKINNNNNLAVSLKNCLFKKKMSKQDLLISRKKK